MPIDGKPKCSYLGLTRGAFRVTRRGRWSILILTALVGACDEPHADKPVTLVTTEVARLEPRRQTVKLTGDVQARVRTELSFRVSGRVTERFVDVGAVVKSGDILAKVDPAEQLADFEGSKAAVKAAEAQLDAATAAFDRQKTLMASGFTTRVAHDQAQEGFETAKGRLEVARAQLGTSEDGVNNTKLRASADGIITARNIEVGQVVQSAQSAYTLAENGARDAVFEVYEALLLWRAESRTIEVSLLSDMTVTARADLREISPTVDATNASVRVKFAIQEAPSAMLLGSPVIGEASTIPVDRIVLPWSSLTSTPDGPAVWLVDSDSNTVSLKNIRVETYEDRAVIVGKGVSVGDRIVTEGTKFLRSGQRVTYVGARA